MLNSILKTLIGGPRLDSDSPLIYNHSTDVQLKTLHRHKNLSSYLEIESSPVVNFKTLKPADFLLNHEFSTFLPKENDSCAICLMKFTSSNKKQIVYKCSKCKSIGHSLCFLTSNYSCDKNRSSSNSLKEVKKDLQEDTLNLPNDENESYYFTICDQDNFIDDEFLEIEDGQSVDDLGIVFDEMSFTSPTPNESGDEKKLIDKINDYDFSSLDRDLIKKRNIQVTSLKVADDESDFQGPKRKASQDFEDKDIIFGTLMQHTTHIIDHGPVNPEIKPTDERIPLLIGLRSGMNWEKIWQKAEMESLIKMFNQNLFGLSIQFTHNPPLENVGDLLSGSIRVFINLLQPIKMVSYNVEGIIHDNLDQLKSLNDQAQSSKKTTNFKLPRGSTLLVHIGLATTATQVVQRLLQRFLIKENPHRFALYEHTIQGETGVVVRKLFYDECPLSLLIRWTQSCDNDPEKMNTLLSHKRFVLQENDTEDIQWLDFGVSELKNFLKILYEKELSARREVQSKYKRRRRVIIKKMSEIWEKLSDEDQALCNPPPVEEIENDDLSTTMTTSNVQNEEKDSSINLSNESLAQSDTTLDSTASLKSHHSNDADNEEFTTLPPQRELTPNQQKVFVKTMSLPRFNSSIFGDKPKKKKKSTSEKKEKAARPERSSLFSRIKKRT